MWEEDSEWGGADLDRIFATIPITCITQEPTTHNHGSTHDGAEGLQEGLDGGAVNVARKHGPVQIEEGGNILVERGNKLLLNFGQRG